MRKIFSLVLILVSLFAFSLKIYPNLIYNIEVKDLSFEYNFFVRNDLNYDAIIRIEKIDFVTDGKKYEFDLPDYKYSVKNYVDLDSYEFELKPDEEKRITLKFNIPSDFDGASGVFALKISQESKRGGQIQIRLNYIVPFFLRFKNINPIQKVDITDVDIRNLNLYPDERYGNFGTLITMKLKNNGNVVFLPYGTIKITSVDLRTTISEKEINSFDLVVFPENEAFYKFKIPEILPTGKVRFSVEGESYGMRFSISKDATINETYENLIVEASPNVIIFDDKTINTLKSILIKNLTSFKSNISWEIVDQKGLKSDIFKLYPSVLRIYPYRATSIKIRSNEREITNVGDRIFYLHLLYDGKKISVKSPLIVVRGQKLSPELKAKYLPEENSIELTNTGNCLLAIDINYSSFSLYNDIVLIPGQSKKIKLEDNISISRIILKYGIFGENKEYEEYIRWYHEKNNFFVFVNMGDCFFFNCIILWTGYKRSFKYFIFGIWEKDSVWAKSQWYCKYWDRRGFIIGRNPWHYSFTV